MLIFNINFRKNTFENCVFYGGTKNFVVTRGENVVNKTYTSVSNKGKNLLGLKHSFV